MWFWVETNIQNEDLFFCQIVWWSFHHSSLCPLSSKMSKVVRPSKYRHVFGTPAKPDECYQVCFIYPLHHKSIMIPLNRSSCALLYSIYNDNHLLYNPYHSSHFYDIFYIIHITLILIIANTLSRTCVWHAVHGMQTSSKPTPSSLPLHGREEVVLWLSSSMETLERSHRWYKKAKG